MWRGLLDEFLDVDRAVAEGLLGLVAGRVVFLGKGDVVVGDAHAPPAAAGDRLDDHRVADLARRLDGLDLVLHRAVAPGNDGDAGLADRFLGDRLVAHHPMDLDLGPMNFILQDSHCWANLAFSERNP